MPAGEIPAAIDDASAPHRVTVNRLSVARLGASAASQVVTEPPMSWRRG